MLAVNDVEIKQVDKFRFKAFYNGKSGVGEPKLNSNSTKVEKVYGVIRELDKSLQIIVEPRLCYRSEV